jgi:hypothetical protein
MYRESFDNFYQYLFRTAKNPISSTIENSGPAAEAPIRFPEEIWIRQITGSKLFFHITEVIATPCIARIVAGRFTPSTV